MGKTDFASYSSTLDRIKSERIQELLRLANLRVEKNRKKVEYVRQLGRYVIDGGWREIFESLNANEKELVLSCARAGGTIAQEELKRIAKNMQTKLHGRSNNLPFHILKPTSKAHIFFPGGTMPEDLCELIVESQGELFVIAEKRKALSFPRSNQASKRISRESRLFQLCYVVEYVHRFSVCKESPQADIKEFLAFFAMEDVCFRDGQLCQNNSPRFGKVAAALHYLDHCMSYIEKAFAPGFDFALRAFASCKNQAGIETGLTTFHYSDALNADTYRPVLFDILKSLPLGQDTSFESILALLEEKRFLSDKKRVIGEVKGVPVSIPIRQARSEYAQAILQILCAIGMVDLVWIESPILNGIETISQVSVTRLGSVILSGSGEPYEEIEPTGRTFFNDDLTITIIDPVRPLQDGFFLKELTRPNGLGSYVFDFQSFTDLKKLDFPVEDFKSRLQEICEVPQSFLDSLDKWEADSCSAEARNVFVIETDDIYLMAEILNMLGGLATPAEGAEVDESQIELHEQAANDAEMYVDLYQPMDISRLQAEIKNGR
ncbi:MAG: hypothetical protein LBT59_26235 [Clostridiales bacterium]|jgi:hypothetical protein|nr:hypothetical protein [Clostridiales bacterium]